MIDYVGKAAMVRPSARQLAWQETEFNAFIHFSVNTFTGREWGTGDEDPSVFNPVCLDAGQWAEVCRSAGMKGLILTCKHHDGFCLWPSAYTGYSVLSSPWKGGRGDVVKEVSEACRMSGLKFGIYLSPWDRHEKTFGDSEKYNDFYVNQLKELLTNYGDIFCVWLDGACGEGPNGKMQVYDWERYYSTVRKLQPDAVISVCGPDVRWCGNEAGHCRESEWSVVPAYLQDAERVAEKSQHEDDRGFSKLINTDDEDLGSRKVIENAGRLVWYPAEVNTSIRPGWFYHVEEDNLVKPAEELLRLYYGSVGGNANLLLNIPPDRRGLIHENDASCLMRLGRMLKDAFACNLAAEAYAGASESAEYHEARSVLDGNPETYWCTEEGTEEAFLEIDLKDKKAFNRVVVMEHIASSGQRVECFALEAEDGGSWREIYSGTVIGYKHICCFEKTAARRIRLKIIRSRLCPTIKFFGVY